MLESLHPPQAVVVWRPSFVFPHQLTSTADLQAWYLAVQVLTTSLGGRAVPSHHAQQTCFSQGDFPRLHHVLGTLVATAWLRWARVAPQQPMVAVPLVGRGQGPLQPFTGAAAAAQSLPFCCFPP